jgi:hypothetical protein
MTFEVGVRRVMNERPKPEDVNNEQRKAILEQAMDEAERQWTADRERRVAAGLVDVDGKPLKETAKVVLTDDGGGW